MDFVTHLPRTSQGHDAVWVIVDRLTKSAHFLVVRMTLTFESSTGCIYGKLCSYMDCQSLSYQIGIPGSQRSFGGVSRGP